MGLLDFAKSVSGIFTVNVSQSIITFHHWHFEQPVPSIFTPFFADWSREKRLRSFANSVSGYKSREWRFECFVNSISGFSYHYFQERFNNGFLRIVL